MPSKPLPGHSCGVRGPVPWAGGSRLGISFIALKPGCPRASSCFWWPWAGLALRCPCPLLLPPAHDLGPKSPLRTPATWPGGHAKPARPYLKNISVSTFTDLVGRTSACLYRHPMVPRNTSPQPVGATSPTPARTCISLPEGFAPIPTTRICTATCPRDSAARPPTDSWVGHPSSHPLGD